MRALRIFGTSMLVLIGLVMLPIWFLQSSTYFNIFLLLVLTVFAAIVTGCVVLATAFAEARVVDQRLEFFSFGIRTRTIPLASIRAFKHFLPGSPAIYILYGSASTYVPNEALDPNELVNLLHAHGVKEESP